MLANASGIPQSRIARRCDFYVPEDRYLVQVATAPYRSCAESTILPRLPLIWRPLRLLALFLLLLQIAANLFFGLQPIVDLRAGLTGAINI
jgi:hypothetical protein